MSKPLILVTNDDGLFAPGIKTLIEVVQSIGTPLVVAPDSPQSGMGHAISIHDPIRLNKVNTFEGVEAYECSGTPVDCVKLARNVVLNGRVPDLCVSGINHGSNVAINILYSGTMSAAMEASLEGINSIGFSLLDFTFDADFDPSRPFVKKIIEYSLKNGFGASKLLNVNIPKLPQNEIKGIKVCRQANAGWKEDFQENRDPLDRPYYWMSGEFVNNDSGEDTDVWALENGYVSVVPCQHDLTAYKSIETLKSLEG
ncbi:MAG: 5'/3'-nucleotidase SurE [Bacteroidota bacterium]